jgi:hypothetical protein
LHLRLHLGLRLRLRRQREACFGRLQVARKRRCSGRQLYHFYIPIAPLRLELRKCKRRMGRWQRSARCMDDQVAARGTSGARETGRLARRWCCCERGAALRTQRLEVRQQKTGLGYLRMTGVARAELVL